MSYHTTFSVSYDLGKQYDKKKYANSITKALRKNYESIERYDSTRQETQNDWFDFIVNRDGQLKSMAYSNLNVLIDIAHQFIRDELTDYVTITFEWDGEESGDYTKNVYHARKTMELGQTLIETTRDKVITQIVEVAVDTNEFLSRNR